MVNCYSFSKTDYHINQLFNIILIIKQLDLLYIYGALMKYNNYVN